MCTSRNFGAELVFSKVVVDSEHYYRSVGVPGVSAWSIRDSHMADVLAEVLRHTASSSVIPSTGSKSSPWGSQSGSTKVSVLRGAHVTYRTRTARPVLNLKFSAPLTDVGITT